MRYARKCDITHEGMNEGWCWGDGSFYTKYESDTVAELRDEFESSVGVQTDDELLEWAVKEDILYWTEWEDEDDFLYQEENGLIIEIEQ